MAYTRRGLAQVDLLHENADQIPFLSRFNVTNYKTSYVYRNPRTAAAAVSGLQEDHVSLKLSYLPVCVYTMLICMIHSLFFLSQVEWAPWLGCKVFYGYGRALTI